MKLHAVDYVDSASSLPGPAQTLHMSREREVELRFFYWILVNGCRILLLFEFHYDPESDWYEARVSLGKHIIGYLHGYANRGWNPQVNNIWVHEQHRRKGIGSFMMSKIGDYFGQAPLPGTPIEDNEAAKGFWKNYTEATSGRFRKRERPPE